MNEQTLEILICFVFPTLIAVVATTFAIYRRFVYAKRMLMAIKRGDYQDASSTKFQRKLRIVYIVGVISFLVMIGGFLSIYFGFASTNFLYGIVLFLIVTSILLAIVINWEMNKWIK